MTAPELDPHRPLKTDPDSSVTTLDLRALDAAQGLLRERRCDWPPAPDGVLKTWKLLLPDFSQACYFAPFQKYAINPKLDLWPEGFNQCHPLPVHSFRGVKRGGMFILLRLADGHYLALLPVTTAHLMTWFRGDDEGLRLEAGHWGTAGYAGDAPLLAWGINDNPYAACEQAWRTASEDPLASVTLKMRGDKTFPEIFEYLGWCTWEEFKSEISESILCDAIAALEASPVPVRWLLVDDGHLEFRESSATRNTQEGADEITGDRLIGIGVHPRRFPHGWEPIFKAAAAAKKLRWLGVWLNFNGYWGGIDGENHLPPELRADLIEIAPGQLVTRDDPAAAAHFYETWIARQQEAGFTFLKVDNQARNVTFYLGKVPNAVAAASGNHQGLEGTTERHMQAMINCMAHNSICAVNTRFSQVTRCSEDYVKGDLWRAKHHLNNSFHNMLWLGQTVWGDHDMFHSSDAMAAELFARSKAVSGGPIYLSDVPREFNTALIRRLCLEDGRILRPLAPAAPLPESIFINTYEDDAAYRIIAPLPHRCAALIAYNLTHPEKPVHGTIQGDDYRFAPGMLQSGPREWDMPAEGVLCFDARQGTARRLHANDRLALELPTFGDAFYLLAPISHGWAILGRADKFLGPCAISRQEIERDRVTLELVESGPVLLWIAEGEPRLESGPDSLRPLGGGLWQVDLPVAPGPVQIILTRRRS